MLTVLSETNRGRVRPANQDCLVSERIDLPTGQVYLCGVADGMGGHLSGDVASQIAVASLSGAVKAKLALLGPAEALRQAFEEANSAVYREAQVREDCAGMGTTLTAALIVGEQVFISHVGDSRAYKVSEGSFTRLTYDHSLVEELIRQGGLSPLDAERHPQRHMLTRALGIEAQIEVDCKVESLRPGEALLLCTDGLTRMLSDSELESKIRNGPEPAVILRHLMDSALERGAPDNVTILLVCREGGA